MDEPIILLCEKCKTWFSFGISNADANTRFCDKDCENQFEVEDYEDFEDYDQDAFTATENK
jgi:hypothetical protein